MVSISLRIAAASGLRRAQTRPSGSTPKWGRSARRCWSSRRRDSRSRRDPRRRGLAPPARRSVRAVRPRPSALARFHDVRADQRRLPGPRVGGERRMLKNTFSPRASIVLEQFALHDRELRSRGSRCRTSPRSTTSVGHRPAYVDDEQHAARRRRMPPKVVVLSSASRTASHLTVAAAFASSSSVGASPGSRTGDPRSSATQVGVASEVEAGDPERIGRLLLETTALRISSIIGATADGSRRIASACRPLQPAPASGVVEQRHEGLS